MTTKQEVQKKFYIQYGIGTAKYLVSYHDGIKKHNDNSNFFDVAIFRNKKKLNDFVNKLINDGYAKE